MKKNGILHPELSLALTRLGHRDRICVADAGLPIPDGTLRIDLAYSPGQPPFGNVLKALAHELVVEETLLTEESPPDLEKELSNFFPHAQAFSVPHERFKEMLPEMRFVVRTGEFSPFTNVILTCGVPF